MPGSSFAGPQSLTVLRMAELGQLERAKRRRLQEAYGDLRPAPSGPDRQVSGRLGLGPKAREEPRCLLDRVPTQILTPPPNRQAKLRDLLTGAMADAGVSAALGSGSAAAAAAAGSPASLEATQALAAAAAANLAAVISSDKRKPAGRLHRPAMLRQLLEWLVGTGSQAVLGQHVRRHLAADILHTIPTRSDRAPSCPDSCSGYRIWICKPDHR